MMRLFCLETIMLGYLDLSGRKARGIEMHKASDSFKQTD